ncbi:MAG: hypothetical protein H3C38_16635 [Rhodospirillales bacterium]|nr:hypothetical protein [Rhodospirillales bacterium]
MLTGILGPQDRESQLAPAVAPQGETYVCERTEPPLGEVIDDQIVQQLMASDGVRIETLLALIEGARRRLVQ